MNQILFYLFGSLAILSAVMILFFRNPVTSGMSLVVSFAMMAAVYIGLDAHFLGVMQILVYTGAVMVLFLFVVMLLNIPREEHVPIRVSPLLGGLGIVMLFIAQLVGVILSLPKKEAATLVPQELAARFGAETQVAEQLAKGNYPDPSLLGMTLFGHYNSVFLLTGVVLVVAVVGVVALSRKPEETK